MGEGIRMIPITALVISVDEPQLPRCLEAVRNQTLPFSDIIHINNVSPENIAFNSGISEVETEWFMKIDGDMVLSPNAVEISFNEIGEMPTGVYCCNFPVYDTFFQAVMRGCGIMNTEICRRVPYPNMLGNDLWFGKKLRMMGYRKINYASVIGIHFENPSELQVFSRFFCQGMKHGKKYAYESLKVHYEQTGDTLYQLGFKAIDFAIKKKNYRRSHDINFDRRMFEEFKCELQ
jgi:glycosyltransferase involved in cell wall biosynthesis